MPCCQAVGATTNTSSIAMPANMIITMLAAQLREQPIRCNRAVGHSSRYASTMATSSGVRMPCRK
ncbi:hypothetical protein D3C79_1050220 [compost metagenome]